MPALDHFSALVTTDMIAAHLDDSDWAVIDCRFDLADPGRGRREYERLHVAGAVHADLDRDLSGTPTGRNGRHPLPDAGRLAEAFGRWGVDRDVQVVAYDQDSGMYASRLWWLLGWLGHDQVAVADGGLAKWIAERRPTRAGAESRAPRRFEVRLRRERMVDARDVSRSLGDEATALIDARAPERFQGRTEPLDAVAGHIPRALNRFFRNNLRPDGTFQSPELLCEQFRSLLGSVPPNGAICYCGSGVTACHDLLAMEHAGLPGARLYPGSWSEWCSDPARPVETGPGRAE